APMALHEGPTPLPLREQVQDLHLLPEELLHEGRQALGTIDKEPLPLGMHLEASSTGIDEQGYAIHSSISLFCRVEVVPPDVISMTISPHPSMLLTCVAHISGAQANEGPTARPQYSCTAPVQCELG